jgi:dihydroorotate dehydrogenase electron transfer subunit
MPEYQENSIVQKVEPLTGDFFRLTLSAPQIASTALPGQFVMAACGPFQDPLLRRPFSIHRSNGADAIQLLIRVIGKGTDLLARAQPGQTLSLIGPLGKGFDSTPDRPICLVGGGIGIAPLLFLAERMRMRQVGAFSCLALLGSRSGAELTPLVTEFNALGCQVETATDDGSLGHHGLVTDLLAGQLARVHRVATCGPQPMMATVAGLCRTAGVPCEASLEAHMACGLGACLGCTVHGTDGRYLHVCKSGPVVNAEEVAWNR